MAAGARDEIMLLLERRLAALRKTRPELGPGLDLQERLIRLSLTSARPPHTPSFPLPRDRVAARVRQGVPLLHDQPVSVDVHYAADLFSRTVNMLLERDDADLQVRLRTLVGAATGGGLDPERLFTEAFVQHHDHLADQAMQAGVDGELLLTLARHAVAPLLQGYAAQLMPLVERVDDGSATSAQWHKGYCPVCGAWPMLGELRGVELAQYLRCSGCGGAWRSRRVLCPYCGNDDYRTLQMLQVEGEQRFRISVCERCKGFLKVGNAFDPPPAELVALDDLASMHLDLAAVERGYQRPGGTGFVIELAVPDADWVEELA
jgi:FdhE protein